MAKITVVDDDYSSELIVENFVHRGHDASRVKSASHALQNLAEIAHSDLVILDIIMEHPTPADKSQISGDRSTGMLILAKLRSEHKDLPIIVFSATEDLNLVQAIRAKPNTTFLSKWTTPSLSDLCGKAEEIWVSALRADPFSHLLCMGTMKSKSLR